MLNHIVLIQIWLTELAAIQAEIEANGMPVPPPRTRRTRKLKPL